MVQWTAWDLYVINYRPHLTQKYPSYPYEKITSILASWWSVESYIVKYKYECAARRLNNF